MWQIGHFKRLSAGINNHKNTSPPPVLTGKEQETSRRELKRKSSVKGTNTHIYPSLSVLELLFLINERDKLFLFFYGKCLVGRVYSEEKDGWGSRWKDQRYSWAIVTHNLQIALFCRNKIERGKTKRSQKTVLCCIELFGQNLCTMLQQNHLNHFCTIKHYKLTKNLLKSEIINFKGWWQGSKNYFESLEWSLKQVAL